MIRFDENWDGPLAGIDPPTRPLENARIEIRHAMKKDREATLGKALAPVLGKGRVMHYAMVRRGIAWDKPRWQVIATAGRNRVILRARRLKVSQVHALAEALAEIPGARDLRLRGRIRDAAPG